MRDSHSIARCNLGHALTNRDNFTSDVSPENSRELIYKNAIFSDFPINGVQSGRMNLDENLIFAGLENLCGRNNEVAVDALEEEGFLL